MWHAGGTERTRCCVFCIAAIWARELANKLLCAECCALVQCGTQEARGHGHGHENEQNVVCFALQLAIWGTRANKFLCAVCWCYVARRHRGTRASKSKCALFALLLFGTLEAQRHGANKLLYAGCRALVLCMWHAGGTGARERTRCCVLCIAAIWGTRAR